MKIKVEWATNKTGPRKTMINPKLIEKKYVPNYENVSLEIYTIIGNYGVMQKRVFESREELDAFMNMTKEEQEEFLRKQ